jgi:arabinogalactan oligomer/maltooligosaccharide transport system permease protein
MAASTAPLGALRSRLRGSGRSHRAAYLYLIPAFAVMGLITLYPLGFQVWMSFTDMAPINLNLRTNVPPHYVGLDNYANIISSQLAIPNFDFLRLIIYNLFWAFSNVAIHLVLGVAIALLLNVKGLWFRKFYRALYIIPVVIPPIIVATVWHNMFDKDNGAVNLILAGVGGFVGIPDCGRSRRRSPGSCPPSRADRTSPCRWPSMRCSRPTPGSAGH